MFESSFLMSRLFTALMAFDLLNYHEKSNVFIWKGYRRPKMLFNAAAQADKQSATCRRFPLELPSKVVNMKDKGENT